MSTLVMALAASMAVGNGPAAVSAEAEQRLDLSGEWEGTINDDGFALANRKRVCFVLGGDLHAFRVADIVDEGRGRFHILESGSVIDHLF
jgi:hypothetical protein